MSRFFFFFFNDTATTEIYTLSLHDALPIFRRAPRRWSPVSRRGNLAGPGGRSKRAAAQLQELLELAVVVSERFEIARRQRRVRLGGEPPRIVPARCQRGVSGQAIAPPCRQEVVQRGPRRRRLAAPVVPCEKHRVDTARRAPCDRLLEQRLPREQAAPDVPQPQHAGCPGRLR